MADDKNDSHPRWDNQSNNAQTVWKRYDEVVAPQIIRAALAKNPPCRLSDLYQVLSVARCRCEYEKEPVKDFKRFSSTFGLLHSTSACEPNISADSWGPDVADLIRERVTGNYIGMSIVWGKQLNHPGGFVLNILEPVFQQLLSTSDFFEFMQLAGQMMYALSNYPPIIRGSAAVNGWLINAIAKEKFHIPSNIRPLLYDWTAYFEAPDQYSAFFLISAISKYLTTIPSVYEKDIESKGFFDSLPDIMKKNPNVKANLQQRQDAWKKIKNYVAEALDGSDLTVEQKKHLESIQHGTIEFRGFSNSITQLVNVLNGYNESHITNDILDKTINDSGCSRERLKKALFLYSRRSEAYISSYGDADKQTSLNAAWADLDILLTLPSKHLHKLKAFLPTLPDLEYDKTILPVSGYGAVTLSSNPETQSEEKLLEIIKNKPSFACYNNTIYYIDHDAKPIELPGESRMVMESLSKSFDEPRDVPIKEIKEMVRIMSNMFEAPLRFSPSIKRLMGICFATWEDIAKVPYNILTLATPVNPTDDPETRELKDGLQTAIWYGGVKFQELAELSMDEIKIITSPEAIALYKKNEFIIAKDILLNPSLISSQPSSGAKCDLLKKRLSEMTGSNNSLENESKIQKNHFKNN